jgi:hypothetical protein
MSRRLLWRSVYRLIRDCLCEDRNTATVLGDYVAQVAEQRKLRFKIRRSDGSEIELEGDLDYVRGKFEELMDEMPQAIADSCPPSVGTPAAVTTVASGEELVGVIKKGNDGRIHFIFQADLLSTKEALALMCYAHHPTPLTYVELSDLLSTGWKTTKSHVVRARASELKREGRLIVESGRYTLSGAGLQWIRMQVIPKVKPQV